MFSLVAVAALSAGLLTTSLDQKETIRVGSSLPAYPLDYLAENTPFTIKGKVVEFQKVPISYDVAGIPNIMTDVVIKVQKDLSGQYTDKTITLRIQGGETEDAIHVYEGTPEFVLGEKVLVLVADKAPKSIYGDNYYVAGMVYGKYSLDNGDAKNHDSNRNMSEKSLEEKIKKAKQPKIDKSKDKVK